ncbi:glycogenin-2-like isoform X3 [Leptotrombidium deliense]|uniref:Glycogenin-2-like isoform X3 n=1 Tax=Leptotrombidium deliense TaxID=299467 RepID=A0A443SGX7_9ACAR|nr:glycogenin-2-like isoform X3 [Leptotrombidium deliense]
MSEMDANFKVPKIPTIIVDNESRRKKGVRENKQQQQRNKKSEDESTRKQVEETTTINKEIMNANVVNAPVESTVTSEPQLPKLELCPACSRVILTYFKPLQSFIADVIKLAESQVNSNTTTNFQENTTSVDSVEETKKQFSQGNYEHRDGKLGAVENKSTTEGNVNSNVQWMQSETITIQEPPLKSQNLESIIESLSVSETHGNKRGESVTNDSNYNRTSETKDGMGVTVKTAVEGTQEVCSTLFNENKQLDHNVEVENKSFKSESFAYGNGDAIETSQKSKPANADHSKGTSNTVSSKEHQNIVLGKPANADNFNGAANTISSSEHQNITLSGIQNVNDTIPNNLVEMKDNSSEVFRGKHDNVGMKSPFAVVTIANTNLMAANAIVMVNSFHLTNNNVVVDSKSGSKIFIPFVIILGGSIDPLLKQAINMIFDEIVGHITNLLFDCPELSASVDYLFPDYFNCSVFVFCPSITTYEELVKFSGMMQASSSKENPDSHEVIDEMTLLNSFFAKNWNKISFIYNYVQNDTLYTQIPAFLRSLEKEITAIKYRFGKDIKIVNFGYMGSNLSTAQNSMFVTQPWHVSYDLLTSSQSDEVLTSIEINNYMKFYLLIFMKRLWPLLRSDLTDLLPPRQFGRRNWTVFDLIQLLSSKSGHEIEDHMFTQTQITFRRRSLKSNEPPVITLTEAKDVSNEEVEVECNEEQTEENKLEEAQESVVPETESLNEEEQLSATIDASSQKEAWESGRVDWMGAHRSDTIIERLKGKIGKNN